MSSENLHKSTIQINSMRNFEDVFNSAARNLVINPKNVSLNPSIFTDFISFSMEDVTATRSSTLSTQAFCAGAVRADIGPAPNTQAKACQ